MKKEMPIQLPTIPNFIRVGLGEGLCLPINDFSELELKEIAERWTEELIKKSRKDN